jgi:hypothetical protein
VTVEPYKFGDERDAWLDDLRRVMADVRSCGRQKNILIRGHIMRGLELDRVDPVWKKLRDITAKFPIDWKAIRELTKHFPSRTDLSKG